MEKLPSAQAPQKAQRLRLTATALLVGREQRDVGLAGEAPVEHRAYVELDGQAPVLVLPGHSYPALAGGVLELDLEHVVG